MLISRDNKIENEDVNLDKDAQGTASTQSACLRASLSVRLCNNPFFHPIFTYFILVIQAGFRNLKN